MMKFRGVMVTALFLLSASVQAQENTKACKEAREREEAARQRLQYAKSHPKLYLEREVAMREDELLGASLDRSAACDPPPPPPPSLWFDPPRGRPTQDDAPSTSRPG